MGLAEFDQRCLRQLCPVHVEVSNNHHEVGVSHKVYFIVENLCMDVVSDFFDLLIAADKCLSVETKRKAELGRLSVRAEKMKARSIIDICNVNFCIEASFESHHTALDGWGLER